MSAPNRYRTAQAVAYDAMPCFIGSIQDECENLLFG
ncbi:hypothetical protein BCCR75502_01498 [Burkholderia sola]|nr:hypothetical protein BCCR75389_01483 [Burkholderia cenocepacia]CAG2269926.1 hypothetical protein BCCR75386_01500 [Burkholderia cenocepacia]CAG2270053.1 hypothetical protein BCCR75388_01501 [Burkholderia cenocepacia]CAG2270285.1 hypothetical protein BCCR75384_01499 [Burkholderia cenocepacia]CAG2270350.1 hypothetical protein BCCR75387_01500 [Burkholderia cenocepacia]